MDGNVCFTDKNADLWMKNADLWMKNADLSMKIAAGQEQPGDQPRPRWNVGTSKHE
jgi:hypothetical protein